MKESTSIVSNVWFRQIELEKIGDEYGGHSHVFDHMHLLCVGEVDITIEDGVYYNTYMTGNKIMMPNPLSEGLVEYNDGTKATEEQMAKDVATFLAWAAEPHLEARHKIGFKAIIYLIILTILAYFSMKRLWSRVEPEV
jgi:ubiquinol-cytochrome c reductase cytochrome c1 subunit